MRRAAILVGVVLLGGAAYSQLMATSLDPSAVQNIVDARSAHYKEIGRSAKAIRNELGEARPDLSNVQASAARIEALAKQIPSWFPSGTGPQPGVKTEALPVIWQQMPLFTQRASGLAGAAHQIASAAAAGKMAETRIAAGSLGNACKSCHDVFREKK